MLGLENCRDKNQETQLTKCHTLSRPDSDSEGPDGGWFLLHAAHSTLWHSGKDKDIPHCPVSHRLTRGDGMGVQV